VEHFMTVFLGKSNKYRDADGVAHSTLDGTLLVKVFRVKDAVDGRGSEECDLKARNTTGYDDVVRLRKDGFDLVRSYAGG